MAVDGFGAYDHMIQHWDELTVLTIQTGNDLTATVKSDYETRCSFKLFDINGQKLYGETVPELSEGVYFIIVLVYTEYEYIPEYDCHEYSGYDYPFILKVVSTD